MIQTLSLDCPDHPFAVRIQVGTLEGQLENVDTLRLEDLLKLPCELGVQITDQAATASCDRIGCRPGLERLNLEKNRGAAISDANISIRPATPADARAIAQVQISGWHSTYYGIVEDDFLQAMSIDAWSQRYASLVDDPRRGCFVAEQDRVIAFATCGPERENRNDFDAELYGIYVDEHWRGRGVGRQLVLAVIDHLAQFEYRNLLIWALAANPYRRFYESLGGIRVDQRTITIGSRQLLEFAYGWHDIDALRESLAGG